MTRIDILAGFLGAGKTTLILEMLKSPPAGERIAICENEYGEVGIDGGTLMGRGVEVVEINAGCVCCTLSINLIMGLKLLIAQHHPDRILLEPTGLASLAEILGILDDDGIKRVATIGTAAAVLSGPALLADYDKFRRYFDSQIASATVLFLNRTGGMDDGERLALMDIIERINPAVRVVAEPYGSAELWEALDTPPDVPAAPFAAMQRLPKSWLLSFKQLSVDTGWSGSKERLKSFIDEKLPVGDVIRAKGFVRDADCVCYRAELAVGVWAFTAEDCGGKECMLFIGRNLAVNAIRQFFNSQA